MAHIQQQILILTKLSHNNLSTPFLRQLQMPVSPNDLFNESKQQRAQKFNIEYLFVKFSIIIHENENGIKQNDTKYKTGGLMCCV